MQQIREAQVTARPQLKRIIKTQGRTQSWIASRIGVSRFLMNHVVAGRRSLSLEQAKKTADILGLPLFLLFDVPDGTE